ncbi:hypothetical protein V6N13_101039 [Hibiscus sabdariffa]
MESSELSGRYLSDSDLTARWNVALKEARKALELGKNLGEDDGSTEVWNEVLDSDVEEMRVLKVSFDEEFRGLIRWWFGSTEGWVVSHVLGYRAVTKS